MILLEADHLSKTLSGPHALTILQDVSLQLRAGESVAIVGVSGAGKSTLLQILGLLERATSGVLRHAGETIPWRQAPLWRNRHLGFIFQGCHLLEGMTPLENVLIPASIAREPVGNGSVMKRRAEDLLECVSMTTRLHTPCRLLSGGEKQRVAIARALIMEPCLLFADEPSGNLDPRTGSTIQDLLLQQVTPQRGLLVVTHDLAFAQRCHHTLQLVDGALQPLLRGSSLCTAHERPL